MTRLPAPRLLLATATAGAALVLSGCQVASPIVTDYEYDPAEGFSVDADSVVIRNAVVVSEGNGAPGVLSGQLVNRTNEPVVVQVTAGVPAEGAQPVEIELPAGGQYRLDGQPVGTMSGEQIEAAAIDIASVPVAAGGVFPVQVQAGGDLASESVPVHLPTGYFSDLAPATAPPTE